MKAAATAESSVSVVKLYPEEYSCNIYRMLYNQDRWVYIVLDIMTVNCFQGKYKNNLREKYYALPHTMSSHMIFISVLRLVLAHIAKISIPVCYVRWESLFDCVNLNFCYVRGSHSIYLNLSVHPFLERSKPVGYNLASSDTWDYFACVLSSSVQCVCGSEL